MGLVCFNDDDDLYGAGRHMHLCWKFEPYLRWCWGSRKWCTFLPKLVTTLGVMCSWVERGCVILFGWTSGAESYMYSFHFLLGSFEPYTPNVPVSWKLCSFCLVHCWWIWCSGWAVNDFWLFSWCWMAFLVCFLD